MNFRSLVLCLAMVAGLSCSKTQQTTDVVHGLPPVSDAFERIEETNRAMATMNPEQRRAYLHQHWPNLEEGIVYFLRQRGRINSSETVSRVDFRYGSLDSVRAEGGDGEIKTGYFNNQLVALVYVNGRGEALAVIVRCLNGMFAEPEDFQSLPQLVSNTPVERFTIGPREGLVDHVPFPVAIDLAERHNLPLYRGHRINRRRLITPAQARQMEPRTDVVQVTVRVYTGDQFDLVNNTYTPARQ